MYRLEREEFVQSPYLALWSLLGFQAGYLNAFGFLACGRYVSHVTGVGTQIGVALAKSSFFFALELIGFPFFFIFGSFLSGVITSARIERKMKPRFDIVTLAIPAVILILLLAGANGLFGVFGEELLQPRDFMLLYMLAFICGVQNGCFAVLTKGQIRTTHLTGISTDIGTDFSRLLFGKLPGKELELTRRTQISRLATFFSFTFGSILSVTLSQLYGYLSLTIPFFVALIVYVSVKLIGRFLDRKFLKELIREETSPLAPLGSN